MNIDINNNEKNSIENWIKQHREYRNNDKLINNNKLYKISYKLDKLSIYYLLNSLFGLFGYLFKKQEYIIENKIKYNVINLEDKSENQLLDIIMSIKNIGVCRIDIDIENAEFKFSQKKYIDNNNIINLPKSINESTNKTNKRKRETRNTVLDVNYNQYYSKVYI